MAIKKISLDSILAATGGYLADRLYSLRDMGKRQFSLEVAASCHRTYWLIIGREHYFETSKEYSISSRRDLKKALALEQSQVPFPGSRLDWIEPIDAQRFRVTTWVIRPEALSALRIRPWVVIPESLLLAQSILTGTAMISRFGSTLFVKGLQTGIASGLASAHIPTLEAFAYRVGATLDADNIVEVDDTEHFLRLLSLGLSKCSVTQLSSCFLGPERKSFTDYPWQAAGVLSSIVFAGYLALSSAWLLMQEFRLDRGLESQGPAVTLALSQQQRYLNLQQQIAVLSKPVNASKPYWELWPVLLDVLKTNARLTSVEYKAGEVTMRGVIDKTTTLLSRLSELPNVYNAGPAAPITSNPDGEDFSIRFYLEAQPAGRSEINK